MKEFADSKQIKYGQILCLLHLLIQCDDCNYMLLTGIQL